MLSVITEQVGLGRPLRTVSQKQVSYVGAHPPYTRARSGTCHDATRERPRISSLFYHSRHDRYHRAFCHGRKGLALRLLVVQRPGSFAAADDPLTLERSLLTGDHHARRLSVPVVVENHPIAGLAHLMRSGGVRKPCRLMPLAALGLSYRRPHLAAGIEAPRRDPASRPESHLFARLAIDVEPFLHSRRVGRRQPDWYPHTPEPRGGDSMIPANVFSPTPVSARRPSWAADASASSMAIPRSHCRYSASTVPIPGPDANRETGSISPRSRSSLGRLPVTTRSWIVRVRRSPRPGNFEDLPRLPAAASPSPGAPTRGMFGIRVKTGHKNTVEDLHSGKTTACMMAQVCFHSPRSWIPAEAGVRKGFCQAVIQHAVFTRMKLNGSSVREGLPFWTIVAMTDFYTYPEHTPTSVASSRRDGPPEPDWGWPAAP